MGTSLKAILFLLPFLLGPFLVEPTILDLLPFIGANNPKAQNHDDSDSEVPEGGDGAWELIKENSGVSAMHLTIMRNNKAVFFDTSVSGPSQMPLPKGSCRWDFIALKDDCWAHGVEMDLATTELRPLKLSSDTWCSSGAFDAEGTLVQAGGWYDGGHAVRTLSPCEDCNWVENTKALAVQRWYSAQQILPDGRFIIIGGRKEMNYEYLPPPGQSNKVTYDLPFLSETTDEVENNLYPFVHLSPDGNLFVFANNRSILFDPRTNKVVKEFPVLRGGSRNYPASGLSVLLPINLNRQGRRGRSINAEVLICGGALPNALKFAMAKKPAFLPALRSCGRMTITKPDPKWHMEVMPTPRVMGDMLVLPTADVLILNGAKRGASSWFCATEPNFEPLLYRPTRPRKDRFRRLAPSNIPRMYHSSSAVLPDTSILVAGSNPNSAYNLTVTPAIPFVTELRLEKFYPPYLDMELDEYRPAIETKNAPEVVKYGEEFSLEFAVDTSLDDLFTGLNKVDVKVTMYAPPFTTHAVSMNQRLLILKRKELTSTGNKTYRIKVEAPPKPELAPSGYYMVFVVNQGVPSSAIWIKVQR